MTFLDIVEQFISVGFSEEEYLFKSQGLTTHLVSKHFLQIYGKPL
jgi:hypothetical protein